MLYASQNLGIESVPIFALQVEIDAKGVPTRITAEGPRTVPNPKAVRDTALASLDFYHPGRTF